MYRLIAGVVATLVGPNIEPRWIYAQMAHETNDFTSELCIKHNNLSGLTQVEPNNLPQPDGKYYYREFYDLPTFAIAYAKYLKLYDVDGIYEVKTMEEYVNCLYRGGYFGDTPENYLEGMKRYV